MNFFFQELYLLLNSCFGLLGNNILLLAQKFSTYKREFGFISLFKNKFIFLFISIFFTFSSVSTIFFLIYLYLFQRNTCLW